MTKNEIDRIVRPYTMDEAKSKIGKYIIKRPGVFAGDDKSTYKIEDIQPDGFTFWEKDYYWKSYSFENSIYDYVFENGSIIGVYI